jgi:tetratricopeptide (TPR) repeat protein
MMKLFIKIILLLSISTQAWAWQQHTMGNCSPVMQDTEIGGSVTIICKGVPQRVVDRLLKELDEKDFTLEEKRRELEELAEKYRSLKNEVEQFKQANPNDTAFVKQAPEALHKGDFAEAERLAGELLDRDLENKVTQAASANFIKGQALGLQFKPVQALPHLKKAYNYRPENRVYAFAYAFLLNEQRQFKQAIPIYEEILQHDRELGDESEVADTLNNLAILYQDTNRYEPAEKHYLEALEIYRKLAQANPKAYLFYVATILKNLALLYRETNRYELAEKHYLEALDIYRKLAQANPKAYLSDVAGTLNNLAILYQKINRYEPAEKHYLEALEIYRKLAIANPKAYLSDVALTLNNLAALYYKTNRYEPAEKHYLEALEIYRKLAQANPKAYLSDVALTLNNLALLYSETNRYEPAEKHYLAALDIRRNLAQNSPDAFEDDLARVLYNIGILHNKIHQYEKAVKHLKESLAITEKLAKKYPEIYGKSLNDTKNALRKTTLRKYMISIVILILIIIFVLSMIKRVRSKNQ